MRALGKHSHGFSVSLCLCASIVCHVRDADTILVCPGQLILPPDRQAKVMKAQWEALAKGLNTSGLSFPFVPRGSWTQIRFSPKRVKSIRHSPGLPEVLCMIVWGWPSHKCDKLPPGPTDMPSAETLWDRCLRKKSVYLSILSFRTNPKKGRESPSVTQHVRYCKSLEAKVQPHPSPSPEPFNNIPPSSRP